MSEQIDQAIQDIAIKHGVLLSKDDPILILHTMNEKLLEDNRKAQEKLLEEFKEEMLTISLQWQNDAKEKSERVLNAALVSSKEVITKLLKDVIDESMNIVKKTASNEMETCDLMKRKKNVSLFILFSSSMLITFLTFLYFFYICMKYFLKKAHYTISN